MGVAFTLLTILFLVVSVCLVLIILVQRPQGGGLAQAFGGGGGGTDTAFGGRTGDALTYATVTAFGLYLVLAIALNIIDLKLQKGSKEEQPAAEQAATAPVSIPVTPAPATNPGTTSVTVPLAPATTVPIESAPAAPAPAAPAAPAPAAPAAPAPAAP